ncbi:MAG TPA: NHL repeat-containing protein [Nitrospirota bacterium]|nr:NHL repeat-containing protein [Nitrospirota bacterium]
MLLAPQGVACTNDNTIVVADTGNGRLLKYTYQNGVFTPASDFKIPELSSPSRVQLDSKGDIYVFDEKERQIVHLGPTGAVVSVVTPTGIPSPGTYGPRSFKIDARDNMYVLDIREDRVLALNSSGAFLREIRFPKDHGFISDIAVDAGGTVYALDSVQRRIYSASSSAQMFTPLTESLKEYMLFPTSLSVDSSGMLYVTDQNGGSIIVVQSTGTVRAKLLSMGWKEGLLRYPGQTCITSSGNLFVADRDNNRIQAFLILQ